MSVSLKAGELDRRITLQTNTPPALSARGAGGESWGTLATVWARYLPKHGREYLAGGGAEVTAEADAVFLIRHRTDVGPATVRISYDGKLWDILSVVEYGRKVGLELVAKARQVAA